jgi:predicted O-methyltransferase YrrM
LLQHPEAGRIARTMLGSLIREGRKAFARALRDRRDQGDLAALKRALPELDAIETAVNGARTELEPAWRTYVTTVSTPVMAASLELAAFILSIARILRPDRILDLGSGFTSYVVRTYAREAGNTTVVTADDNAAWLARTRSFLDLNHLSTDEMWVWSELSASSPPPFQLVVHDLGSMPVRTATLPRVLELAAPHGLVVLDDISHPKSPEYREAAPEICRRAGRRLLFARKLTLDGFGRYAAIALPR